MTWTNKNTKYTLMLVSSPLQHLTPEERDEHHHTNLLSCCPQVATTHNDKYFYIPALHLPELCTSTLLNL